MTRIRKEGPDLDNQATPNHTDTTRTAGFSQWEGENHPYIDLVERIEETRGMQRGKAACNYLARIIKLLPWFNRRVLGAPADRLNRVKLNLYWAFKIRFDKGSKADADELMEKAIRILETLIEQDTNG
jgi:hypothetical protein